MQRPTCFEEIKGHDWLVSYFKEHIKNGTLPHFYMIDGPEGLGKTSIVDVLAINLVYGLEDSVEKQNAIKSVIEKKQSNDYIRKYWMSAEGGKDTAKMVAEELRVNMSDKGVKVIIMDECHGLSDAAQDVFLPDTEYIPKGVYIFMLTTELHKIKASLQSRAVNIQMHPLKKADMVRVLATEVEQRNMKIQGGETTLGLIADYAGYKPRTGLSILSAFADGAVVNTEDIKEMIGFLTIEDVLPLFKSLSGSLTFGLSLIMEMVPNDSIIQICYELIRLKSGAASYNLKMTETHKCKEELSDVSLDQLVIFLEVLTSHYKVTKQSLINAFIKAHKSKMVLVNSSPQEVLRQELAQKSEVIVDNTVRATNRPPTLDDLFHSSDVIQEREQ